MAGMTGLELHEACSTGDYDSLEDYIHNRKFDLNMGDPEFSNRTPMHWACQKGFVDCLRLLLDSGADGNARMDMGWTPAHCAAEAGKLLALRALHSANVPIDQPDQYGDTPRRIAQMYGHEDCVNYLLQAEKERQLGKPAKSEEQHSDSDTLTDSDST